MWSREGVTPVALAGLIAAAAAACSSSSPGLTSSAAATSAAASSYAPPTSSAPAPPVRSSSPPTSPPSRSVPAVAVSTAPPVPIGRAAPLTGEVRVTVGAPRAVQVTARGPGEVGGSAIAVPVSVRNTSSTAFDLGGLVVNAAYGSAATPAPPTDADPAAPLTGRLAPGRSASGTYVFTAPASAVSRLRVEVSSDATARILVFRS